MSSSKYKSFSSLTMNFSLIRYKTYTFVNIYFSMKNHEHMTNVSWPIRGIETVVAVNPKFSAIYQTWREAGHVGTWVRKSSLFSWKNRGSSSWSLLDLSARWLYNLPRTLHVIHNHYLTPITEAVYYYLHFPLCNVYQPPIIYNRSCKREIFLVHLSRSSFRLITFAL